MSLNLSITSVPDVIYRLGFANAGEMSAPGSWVTQDELFAWADEAAKRLAVETLAFADLDTSITITPGTAAYALAANHIHTVLACIVYPSGIVQGLRLTAARDLWALDGNWQTTTGDSRRASLDTGQDGTIALYPIPVQGGTLWQVFEGFPATISAASPDVSLPPTVMQDWFSYRMLAGARAKESPYADQAMSQHFNERANLYSQVAAHLWGKGL